MVKEPPPPADDEPPAPTGAEVVKEPPPPTGAELAGHVSIVSPAFNFICSSFENELMSRIFLRSLIAVSTSTDSKR